MTTGKGFASALNDLPGSLCTPITVFSFSSWKMHGYLVFPTVSKYVTFRFLKLFVFHTKIVHITGLGIGGETILAWTCPVLPT